MGNLKRVISQLKRTRMVLSTTIIILVSFCDIQAQDLKIQVNKKGKVGFVDSSGKEVIKCEYESAYPFKNGHAIVCKSGKYGIINQSGENVLPIKYSKISSWNENLYLIKTGKTMGLADHSGKIILATKYTMITRSNRYGKALIALGGKSATNEKQTYMSNAKYGIIDKNGKILIEPKYKGLYEFSYNVKNEFPFYEGNRLRFSYHYITDTLQTDCSYLGFSKNGMNVYGCGIMDINGKELIKPGLYDLIMLPQSNMARFYITKKKETICGYHNIETGESITPRKFDMPIAEINFWSHGDFIGNIAPINGETWSFIDRKGNILRTEFNSLKHSEILNLWAAKKTSGVWDVFDNMNKDIQTLSGYENIEFPQISGDKEVFSVEKDNLFGCITREGEVVVPFEYDQTTANVYNVILVKKNSHWGAITPDNESIIPIEFEYILSPSERNTNDFWVMKSDSLFYHFKSKEQTISKIGYKDVSNFINGIAHVAPTDMPLFETVINKAQIHLPNTSHTIIGSTNFDDSKKIFGYLLKNDDTYIMDYPVSTLYRDAVIKEMKNYKDAHISENIKKQILLKVTKENRSYDLKSTIEEGEWNY